ncbi:hypothetical protein Pan44_54850 [Caulifigura coniformis]|uniref:Uncharacterized protein n=1 Tax=Caulifigura coniformis TaxID=2527983 RepID=A0A517SMT0_9PLAN|nr:hypothetical protein [Caulifigura coniformis]QDT57416.1 hypothetical protein Pan44_54850 [Caulifigura coniformis]
MNERLAKPPMRVRLRRAGIWLIPMVVLAIVRKALDVPDEFLAMPANGIPPTRFDGVINVLFAASVLLGIEAFLARLVRDDSAGLSALLIGVIAFQGAFTGMMLAYVLLS